MANRGRSLLVDVWVTGRATAGVLHRITPQTEHRPNHGARARRRAAVALRAVRASVPRDAGAQWCAADQGSGWCTTPSRTTTRTSWSRRRARSVSRTGMKSLAARFARCVNRVFGRVGRVLQRIVSHHVVKRTPTEVRRAVAYRRSERTSRASTFGSVRRTTCRRWCWTGRVRGCAFRRVEGPVHRPRPGVTRTLVATTRSSGDPADLAAVQGLAARIGLIDPAEVPGVSR